jgi:cardiolipin synthase
MVAVDSRIGYVTGLCVGHMWVGDERRGIDPWRDTGMELRGPALRDVERAFAQVWAATGPPLPDEECLGAEPIPAEGDVAVRIVANAPGTASLLRVDQIVAGAARETLWLTDAYFAGVAPYLQALRAAALDGVDVRLLVPGSSDIPLLRPLSQAGFRPLLEAGVRVFEWKGCMLHAKTGVADGRWARVGSSNLNIASWIGNYELDAVVEDAPFAESMEAMYLADLDNATEIVLQPRRRSLGARNVPLRERRSFARDGASGGGSASRAAAGALRIGRAVGAALSDKRVLATTDARVVAIMGAVMLAVAAAAVLWPLVVGVPIAILLTWFAIALLARAHELRRERRLLGLPRTRLERAAADRSPDTAAPRPPAGD